MMTIRSRVLLCGVALAVGSAAVLGANPAPGGGEALSSDMRLAIGELSSDSFKAREKAVKDLRAALAEQMHALVAAKDAGAKSKAIAALEYETGLSRWALETLKLSNEQRKAAMDFGMKPDVTGVLAEAFSPNVAKRFEGIKSLGKLEDAEASALLARIMEDPERKVYLAAMEAAADRKPTRELVDAIWNHAVGSNLWGVNPSIILSINADGDDELDIGRFQQMNDQDCDKAATILIKLKSPRVAEHLVQSITILERVHAKSPPGTAPMMFNMPGPMKSFFRLLEAEKPREVYAPMYRIATEPSGQVMNAVGQFYMSNRTAYIAEFLKLIGEKTDDYKLKQGRTGPGAWTFPAEADETAALAKVRDWWEKHGSEYEGPATTAPAGAEH